MTEAKKNMNSSYIRNGNFRGRNSRYKGEFQQQSWNVQGQRSIYPKKQPKCDILCVFNM